MKKYTSNIILHIVLIWHSAILWYFIHEVLQLLCINIYSMETRKITSQFPMCTFQTTTNIPLLRPIMSIFASQGFPKQHVSSYKGHGVSETLGLRSWSMNCILIILKLLFAVWRNCSDFVPHKSICCFHVDWKQL